MARLHIQGQVGLNLYDVIVHSPVPATSNSAGVPWAVAIKNSGRAVTILQPGSGSGLISPSEAAAIEAGTVLETRFQWQDNPQWNNPQRLADLNDRATQAVSEALNRLSRELRFFGYEVA